MALFVTKQFPTILVQTSEETVTPIPPGIPWWKEPVIPPHSLLMPMHAFRAYI